MAEHEDTTSQEGSTFGGMSRRQMLAGLAAASAGAGAISMMSSSAQAAPLPLPPFRKRGKLKKRPNFLVIMVDEQRAPVSYESQTLKDWRAANLHGQNALLQHGLSFTNHQIMSAACAPSRTSFWTGQYPSLHGVTQTSGAAKSALEEDLYWLHPNTVPTMGNYFRTAGYDTWYRGKWHVSDADLFYPGTNSTIPSYDDNGVPDPAAEKFYEQADLLGTYGFSGYVGPEPHGSNPQNSGASAPYGVGRDSTYARLGVKSLHSLKKSNKPWLLVTSFVNPHDIVLWGAFSLLFGTMWLEQRVAESNVPTDLFDPSVWDALKNETLASKPSAQTSYRDTYSKAFQPIVDNELYSRFYYALQQTVDARAFEVMSALMADAASWRDTIVLYVSDHGELLGSHGGLHQKWHNAYDAVMRVPFIVHNPVLFPTAAQTDVLSCHADVLPTMLGLAGINVSAVQKELRKTHNQVQPLVGRDLSGVLLGEKPLSSVTGPVYFMTDDEPTRGQNQITMLGNFYASVAQPNHIETVVAQLPTGAAGALEQWKYSRYFDNNQFWTTPGVSDTVTTIVGSSLLPTTKEATTVVKQLTSGPGVIAPPPDEFEMYNMTVDRNELDNLYDNGAYAVVQAQLATLLTEQRDAKRLVPVTNAASIANPVTFAITPRPQNLRELDVLEDLGVVI